MRDRRPSRGTDGSQRSNTMHRPDTDLHSATLQQFVSQFGPLRRAELLVLDACASGDIAKVGLRRPEEPSADASVRASFLAFILRGGLRLRHRRLQILGAYVEGRLDLEAAEIPASLWFYRCWFDSPVMLDGARVAGAVTFAGCRLPRLLAEDCSIGTDLALNAGCAVEGEVLLTRAHIAGHLDCARLDLRGAGATSSSRRALRADASRIGGDVRLTEGFQSVGEVRFVGARVEGDFHASGHFTGNLAADGGRGAALLLDRIVVGGSVRFDAEFGAAGQVGLRRACIDGDLDATGASFDRLGDAAWGDDAVLVLDRARVDGALVLRQLQTPLVGASFVRARVGSLADDVSSWGGRLVLDGFSYERFDDGAPLDTVFRVDWLERQEPTHLQDHFRVQPWRRLIRVLRRMGHDRRAGSIAVRRERRLRHIGWVGAWAPPALRWLPRAGHAMLGLLAGYGYRPWRLVAWLAAVWLLCGGVYWAAGQQGAGAPGAPAETLLGTLAYSLDRLLPLVELGTQGGGSVGSFGADAVRWLGQVEAGFGWLAAVLLLASLAGWVDRDRRR
jgi:hypothetical protein